MKIALTSIGCKLNQSEINELRAKLEKTGYFIVAKNKPHDLHILNACSVTHGAEQITRQKIRKAKRKNKKLQILVMGCLNNPIPEINKVFKNSTRVFKYIKKQFPIESGTLKSTEVSAESRTRALIKIQSGCDFSCTYCIINKFRGKSKSIPLAKIIQQIKKKEKQDCKEIVLVGQSILQYNYKNNNLTGLVIKILKQTQIPRIRFSSLDPRLVDTKFLALLKNQRICPHLHLSLQSGSNKILKLMNRNYTTEEYLKIIKQAQKINPLTSITTDIIVGFPWETEKDFQNTINLVSKINFLKIHIFPYSSRTGTKSAEFKNKIMPQIKKDRCQKLNALSLKQKQKFLKGMKGQKLAILFEQKKNEVWQGFSQNYIKFKKKSKKNITNQIIDITY